MAIKIEPPVAKRVPHEVRMHGDVWDDPYFWLRERSEPDVLDYLRAENAYGERAMQYTERLREQLYHEMVGRIKETDSSVPERRGDYFYGTRTEQGKQYPIVFRQHRSLDAPEELLLDQNELAVGQAFCRVGAWKPSPDHRLLAYAVDFTGTEDYLLVVKDLATGMLLPDQVRNVSPTFEWASDSATLFYPVLDPAARPYKLLRHTLGTDPAADVEVFHEPDEAYALQISKTRSNAFLLILLQSKMTTEVHYAPADQPDVPFQVLQPRVHGLEYYVDHHGERFLIVANDEAVNFKLLDAPVAAPGRDNWRELIPHRESILVERVDAFQDFLAVYERANGLRRIRLCDPFGHNPHYIDFPEPVYSVLPMPNPEFAASALRFTYTSQVTPNTVVDYHVEEQRWETRKQDEIPSGYDPTHFRSARIMAPAQDGVAVPISLVYPADLELHGRNPLLLFGYGSYGHSYDPVFSTNLLSLLERGWAVGIAHIRGGGELGEPWYHSGRLLRKKNTFTDFIACAEQLIALGYTDPAHLAISGTSAGGLLMGAVLNMRPDLFKAALARVPFVDVINTMSDPSLPLTVTEYEEWGNPADPRYYAYMRSYSPYDNVQPQRYPHLLVTSSLNDRRVAYWEPAKWVARLRTVKTDTNRLLLKTNIEAGHAGSSGRYDYLNDIAFEYAFLLDVIHQ
jgi:oligopeptidase B